MRLQVQPAIARWLARRRPWAQWKAIRSMENVLDFLGMLLRVLLAGMVALTPGMLVWHSIIAVCVLVRQLRHRMPVWSRGPTPIQNPRPGRSRDVTCLELTGATLVVDSRR